jgi:hypothetical protein
MLKNILKLDGALALSQKEQKTINGGIPQGCTWVTYPGTSLAECRLEYPNASYRAGVCRALACYKEEVTW